MSAFSDAAVADPFDFDAALLLEQSMYEAGVVEGAQAAREEAFFLEEGRRGGFLRGYAIGLETGFMERVVGGVPQVQAQGQTQSEGAAGTEGPPPSPPAPSSASASVSVSVSTSAAAFTSVATGATEAETGTGAGAGVGTGAGDGAGTGPRVSRGERRRAELLDRIRALPLTNSQAVDFVREVAALRALYKQVCASSPNSAGAFLPAAAAVTAVTQQW